jgi:hypothetical protein
VPLNLNVNDIDPYETSLGRESRFGTMSSEIDLRPNPFDKGGLNNPEFQVNSAERRSKFDASKFTWWNIPSWASILRFIVIDITFRNRIKNNGGCISILVDMSHWRRRIRTNL